MAGFRRSTAHPSAASPEERSGPPLNVMRRLSIALSIVAAWFMAATAAAHGSVAVLLEQPYGVLGVVSPMGHVAVYVDHVCAATPLELRPCRPGELGVVISRYDGIGNRDWVAVPLLPYLYAVESAADIPETMDREQEALLRDLYRRHALESVAPDLPDGSAPAGNWYELAGSALDRTIYGFSVATTPEQDAKLIAIFNDRRNVERYQAQFRNCADFVRTTINEIYPHAIRRNFVGDFGFTTPKSVARGLTRYAQKHPNVDFHVFMIPQVPGSIPRSYGIQGITEGLIKRYGVPLVVLSPLATAIVFVAYLGHGRFEVPHNAPVLDLRSPVLDVNPSTTVEAATQQPSTAVPLPAPSGADMRPTSSAALPATPVTHDDTEPLLDTPMLTPTAPSPDDPIDFFVAPASE